MVRRGDALPSGGFLLSFFFLGAIHTTVLEYEYEGIWLPATGDLRLGGLRRVGGRAFGRSERRERDILAAGAVEN